ncbi:MAG: hypothetical protein ACREO3_10555, partial [Arenimonas sp.]
MAARLLAAQPKVREPNPAAREWSLLKRLRHYDQLFTLRPTPLGPRELAFWTIPSDADLEEFLFDNLLRSAPLAADDPDWQGYPRTYR